MKPVVHGLEAEYWGQIDFVYIDRENPDNTTVVNAYGIASQPIFILINPDGTEAQRWFGAPSADTFREAFDTYLAASGG